MGGVGGSLFNGVQVSGNGDGHRSRQIGLARFAFLGHGNAADLVQGLAFHIVGQRLDLLVPFLADGTGLDHAVVAAQLVFGEHGGGQVGGDGAGGIKVDFGLDGVDDAVVDDPFIGDGHGHQFQVGLGDALLFRGGAFAARNIGAQVIAGFDRSAGIFRGGYLGGFAGRRSRLFRLGSRHHGGAAAGSQGARCQCAGQDQCKQFFHG